MGISNGLIAREPSMDLTLSELRKKIFWDDEVIAGHICADAYTCLTRL